MWGTQLEEMGRGAINLRKVWWNIRSSSGHSTLLWLAMNEFRFEKRNDSSEN